MKKLSHKQSKIMQFCRENNGKITKKQAVELVGGNIYHNADKYVGETLKKMVDGGLLERESVGNYKLKKLQLLPCNIGIFA